MRSPCPLLPCHSYEGRVQIKAVEATKSPNTALLHTRVGWYLNQMFSKKWAFVRTDSDNKHGYQVEKGDVGWIGRLGLAYIHFAVWGQRFSCLHTATTAEPNLSWYAGIKRVHFVTCLQHFLKHLALSSLPPPTLIWASYSLNLSTNRRSQDPALFFLLLSSLLSNPVCLNRISWFCITNAPNLGWQKINYLEG